MTHLTQLQFSMFALIEHFLRIYGKKYNLTGKDLSVGALAKLQEYHWPGNIRELRHVVERALIMSESKVLDAGDFLLSKPAAADDGEAVLPKDFNLESVEKSVVRAALTRYSGNISHAASALGITRTSLYRRMEKYEL